MDATLQNSTAEAVSAELSQVPASRFAGKRVHFIGIGGCGMSGLARMLLDAGAIVSGSEPKPNEQTLKLAKRGVQISRNQMGELLNDQVDLVVRTAAVPDNNIEYRAAQKLGITGVKYARMLGMVMQERLGVAVAGTHGKSTTTAMISYALLRCGVDPSFVVGGTAKQLGGGSHSGAGKVFVAEACEYDRSFHNLHPRIALITNIEEDHLDCYTKGIDEIIESFHYFAGIVPANGLILANGEDANVTKALAGLNTPIELVGRKPGFAWSVGEVEQVDGCHHGVVFHHGKVLGMLKPALAGAHNLFNATMATAACVACGVDAPAALAALGEFTGVDRRMTEVGKYNGATVIDDYGHHPTEIQTTLKALREKYRPSRLLCVFQPHQHSRTRFLLKDFASSFELADQTIVPDIYFVRDSEAERQSISSAELVARIMANGQQAVHLPGFEQIVSYLKQNVRTGDLVVTMGAGNVCDIGRDLVGG